MSSPGIKTQEMWLTRQLSAAHNARAPLTVAPPGGRTRSITRCAPGATIFAVLRLVSARSTYIMNCNFISSQCQEDGDGKRVIVAVTGEKHYGDYFTRMI